MSFIIRRLFVARAPCLLNGVSLLDYISGVRQPNVQLQPGLPEMSAPALTIRLKAKLGQHIIRHLTTESTLGELKRVIADITKIRPGALRILKGFPPRVVDLSNASQKLTGLGIQSGDTLIVEEDVRAREAVERLENENLTREMAAQLESEGGILVRQVVPANNSCLFTSVNFVMEGGKLDISCADSMRQLIASVVASDCNKYNKAILGQSNEEYCTWILDRGSWGGAIELSILSQYYGTEIDVIDTQSVRVNRFGEDQNYSKRVLLIYDGIHYDPLMVEHFDTAKSNKTIFSTTDDTILTQALDLAAEAKSSRQFTDVAKFTLRCLICQKRLIGDTEAQEHAKDTGHINFSEV